MNTQHATRNTQHATRNTQHATRNTQHATRNTQHATRNTQHATRNTQHATRNTQHATRNTQHATRNTQHATRKKRLNVTTRRPFDLPGLQVFALAKAGYEGLSEETRPSGAFLISNTLVPEIEMPGHSSAAIAAYPWLGTAGKVIDVPVKFGRHYDNYDVTKPEVIQFIQDVLMETFALFPSQVIHVGGDEVGFKSWEDAEHVRKYMEDNGINTPADLQVRFTNDISRFIEKNGRRMMGWNEIMGVNIHKDFSDKKDEKNAETELAENVIVHFWKGDIELATDAAQKECGIVNALLTETYLDYTYESTSLKKAYSFNPIPEGLEEKYHENVYGLGCQMWTEWTPNNADVERQTFPRIAAYAEVGWTALDNKDFDRFKRALEKL